MSLRIEDHDRRRSPFTYVYAVVSRRSHGLSLGINLNPNNACNWRCVYCEIPGLVQGKAPDLPVHELERELGELLEQVLAPGWLEAHCPEGMRRLNDLAFSGNGEPTASPRFTEAVEVAIAALARRHMIGQVKLVLITNGSLLHTPRVQAGIARLAEHGGEVWFKLDSATEAGMRAGNSAGDVARQLANLRSCARLAPTWVQSCWYGRDGAEPAEAECAAFAAALEALAAEQLPLRGVYLYGIARPSYQPEAPRLARLPAGWFEAFGQRLRRAGYPLEIHP